MMYRDDDVVLRHSTPAEPIEAAADAIDGYKRPLLRGEALEHGPGRSVPKPAALIEISEVGNEPLHRVDRQLLNVLLAVSWRALGRNETGPFGLPACLLREAIGQGTRSDNQRLRESLERLCRIPVCYHRLTSDGQDPVQGPLLEFAELPSGGEFARWGFADVLLPELFKPSAWTRIDLDLSAAIDSRHVLVLYEHFVLKAGLRWPVWQASLDELRGRLGLGARSHGWHDVRRIIEAACREIHRRTDLRVTWSVDKDRRTRRVETVEFRFTRRKTPPPAEIRPAVGGDVTPGRAGRAGGPSGHDPHSSGS